MTSHLPKQLLTCQCGDYTLGFDVQDVQEILTEQPMTRVPRAPKAVCGLLNLRGDVVPALYLHRILGLADSKSEPNSHKHLIITVGPSTLSLIVDDVGEVIELSSKNYFTELGGLQAPFKELVLGMYQIPTLTVLHLNPEASCRITAGGHYE
jgi:purine-binding chemotaxis protein CheW